MATKVVTAAESWIENGLNLDALIYAGTTLADVLTIEAGTFLMANNGGHGVHLDNRGAWTVTLHGHLFSTAGAGILLDAGNVGASAITVSADGSIAGFLAGISVGGNAATPTGSAATVVNNGTIIAEAAQGVGIHFNSPGAHTVVNTGEVWAATGILSIGGAADTVTNSGWMSAIFLGDGTNSLTNNRFIDGNWQNWSYVGGTGADTVTNHLTMIGGAHMGEGTNKLTNNGFLGNAGASYWGGSGSDTFINTAKAETTGGVILGNGSNSLNNAGLLGSGYDGLSVVGGGGIDTLVNSGIMEGMVYLRDLYGDWTTAANRLDNSGVVGTGEYGVSYFGDNGSDQIYNRTGTTGDATMGALYLKEGTNYVENTGLIGRITAPPGPGISIIGHPGVEGVSIWGGGGADTVINRGAIAGSVLLGSGVAIGTNTLANLGSVGADSDGVSFVGDSGIDTITNSALGTLAGGVWAGDGTNSLNNAGAVGNGAFAYTYFGGTGIDTITNTGTFTGFVRAGDGINRLDNSNFIGADSLGVSYAGGNANDTVNNKDTLALDAIMVGAILLGEGTNSLTNSGFVGAAIVDSGDASTLDGISVLGSIGIDTVINSGVLAGSVVIGYVGDITGTNILNNTGTVRRDTSFNSYSGGDGADTVTNTRTMTGAIFLGEGTNIVTNSGNIGETDIQFAINGGGGNDTVTNTKPGWISGRLTLGNGDNALTNSGTVWYDAGSQVSYFGGSGKDTINNTNKLLGSVQMGDGANLLINSGTVGTGAGVDYQGGSGVDDVRNTGKILGSVILGDGTNLLVNSGTMGAVDGGANADTITNELTGKMGRVVLGDGVNSLTNKGLLDQGGLGIVGTSAVASEDKIINSGTILGFLDLGTGKNSLTNSGVVGLDSLSRSYIAGEGTNTIVNSKTLGGIELVGGTNTLTNTGTIGAATDGISYQVMNGVVPGGNTITNAGKLVGSIVTGDGKDLYTGFVGTVHGTVGGIIDLGGGNDTVNGGNAAETVMGGDGLDTVNLNAGDDWYHSGLADGSTSIDTVNGGAGVDTYSGGGSLGLFINIDTVVHAATTGFYVNQQVALGTANTGAVLEDRITAFENVVGSSHSDLIFGSALANKLEGLNGGDAIWGYAGNDTIEGGGSADYIVGGLGADLLSGGADADIFVLLAATESTALAAGRDKIADFTAGVDKIDLSLIDTNATLAGVQHPIFHFIGTNQLWDNSGAGQIRSIHTATGQIVEIELTGDKKADMAIEFINDRTHSLVFDDSMFIYDAYVADMPDGGDGGTDTIVGSAGGATYDGSSAAQRLRINIDTVAHADNDLFQGGGTFVAAASVNDLYGNVLEQLSGFTDVKGSDIQDTMYGDLIYGSSAANKLQGLAGPDALWGFHGNDTIEGGANDDLIVGGSGADMLSGGHNDPWAVTDFDGFAYLLASDSTVNAAGRDTITDFRQGHDFIMLQGLDTDPTLPGVQQPDFHVIMTTDWDDSGAGQIRFLSTATGQIVEIDLDGNKTPDFAIEFLDPSHEMIIYDGMFAF